MCCCLCSLSPHCCPHDEHIECRPPLSAQNLFYRPPIFDETDSLGERTDNSTGNLNCSCCCILFPPDNPPHAVQWAPPLPVQPVGPLPQRSTPDSTSVVVGNGGTLSNQTPGHPPTFVADWEWQCRDTGSETQPVGCPEKTPHSPTGWDRCLFARQLWCHIANELTLLLMHPGVLLCWQAL